MRIADVVFRGVLESSGSATIEAQIATVDGAVGRASAPVAIAPGARERQRTSVSRLGRLDGSAYQTLRSWLQGRALSSQAEFDYELEERAPADGANVKLALSVAYLRAAAASAGQSAITMLSHLAGTEPALPRPLINVFSGGIHEPGGRLPFQELMLAPQTGNFVDDLQVARRVIAAVESALPDQPGRHRASTAGGIIVDGEAPDELFERLDRAIAGLDADPRCVRVAADLAAEHLRTAEGRYRFGTEILERHALRARLLELVARYDIAYLEDPFAFADLALWRQICAEVPPDTLIGADDLFATNAAFIASGLARAIVVKPSQIGTITATLAAVRAAREIGLALVVSHRSRETEDAFICDLAVALGATFIKIGGLRGDRGVKYNRLLRLAEEYGDVRSESWRMA